jgi:hypothetical protein
MGFADSIKIFGTKALSEVDAKTMSIAEELFTEVVNNSPTKPSANYAKGEFINNWMAAANHIDGATRGSNDYSGMGSRNSISSLRGGHTFFRKDGMVTLTNNTSYSFRVEYAGWPSPTWSGNVGPYAPIAKAFISVAPKYRP